MRSFARVHSVVDLEGTSLDEVSLATRPFAHEGSTTYSSQHLPSSTDV